MNLKDILEIIPDFINLFLSGFIFIYAYNWLNNRDNDISIITIWSVIISCLIKSSLSALHIIILPSVTVPDSVKIIIYFIIGLVLAVVAALLKRKNIFAKILYFVNYKSVNNDIFDDLIDYQKRTMMLVYLKSSDIYYVGRFNYREEKGSDSWIALIHYCSINAKTRDIIDNYDNEDSLPSSVLINFRSIERIELIYENDSELWKWLNVSL